MKILSFFFRRNVHLIAIFERVDYSPNYEIGKRKM